MQTDPDMALRYMTDLVRNRYKTDQSQHAPMVFVFHNQHVSTIVQLDFDNDYMKSISIENMRNILRGSTADCTVFVSEGWVVKQPMDSELVTRARDNPRRIEVLLLEVSAPGRHMSVAFEMKRDDRGRLLDLVETHRVDSAMEGMASSSRFDFFNDGSISEVLRIRV